jgi:hydrogenase maturation protein HypF
MVRYALESSPHRHVVLTGGVFMNRILTEIVTSRLTELGITPLIHRKTPPNDACVSFGQALIAGW